MHCPNTKIFLANACFSFNWVKSMSRRNSLDTRLTNSFFRKIVGTSSNIASHSCGLMPSELIM